MAQRFPNLFRALFAEGAFNNAFVPQFAGASKAKGKARRTSFALGHVLGPAGLAIWCSAPSP